MTPFVPALLVALEANSRRSKRDRCSALMLFEALKKDGYAGGYSILTDYVRHWRNGLIPGAGRSAFVPLKFQLGEAFHFDWSDEWFMIKGSHRKLQAAHTKLRASRAFSVCLSNANPGRSRTRTPEPSQPSTGDQKEWPCRQCAFFRDDGTFRME
ncbi:MAG: hypothetical protein PHY16_07215 [Methylobacter sp.]|nr:hypothetical protein [Methylobacter sp.]